MQQSLTRPEIQDAIRHAVGKAFLIRYRPLMQEERTAHGYVRLIEHTLEGGEYSGRVELVRPADPPSTAAQEWNIDLATIISAVEKPIPPPSSSDATDL